MNCPVKHVVIEDTFLVEKAKSGDSDAFGELVRRYQMDVRAFLRFRINDKSIADDLAQEVFLGAMQSIGGLRKSSSVRSWLLSIARFKMIDFIRSENRRKSATSQLQLALENGDNSVSVSKTNEDEFEENVTEILRVCISKLQPKARNVLEMYYYQEIPATKIAAEFEKKPNAIRMKLLRIRNALAKCIQKRIGKRLTSKPD